MTQIESRAQASASGPNDFADWHAQANARIYGGYLALQAIAGILLWLAVAESATVRSWFEVIAGRPEVMNAFGVADMGVVVTSAISAWAVTARRPWAPVLVAFTAAGLLYPTLWLVGWVVYTDGGGAALALMIAPTTITCWLTVLTWRSRTR